MENLYKVTDLNSTWYGKLVIVNMNDGGIFHVIDNKGKVSFFTKEQLKKEKHDSKKTNR